MLEHTSSSPLTTPLFTASVYVVPDLDALDRIYDGESDGFIYARDGHPNARRLSEQLAELEGAAGGIVCGSGMASISAVLLSILGQGERIVASNLLYGRTTQLLRNELSRFGIQTTFVDPCDPDQVEEALCRPGLPRPRALLVETLSNPLLRLVDVAQLSKLAHANECTFVVDNTFATPVLCRPLLQGADFVIESLTKMISGHSDVTLGWVGAARDLKNVDDVLTQLAQVVSIWGFSGSPFDAWLTERGLATLPLRMERAAANALEIARWLADQREIERVAYPGLPSHREHELAARTLTSFGNLVSFELTGGREGVNRLMRMAPEVPFSPSLGNVTTTWSHPASTSHRYDSPAERQRQGISDGLIRLSVGVEDVNLLRERIAKGLG